MFTNTGCTIFLYSKDGLSPTEALSPGNNALPSSRYGSWKRIVMPKVYWESVEHASFTKNGQRGACSALVVIPAADLQEHLHFTHGKDLIIKGIVDFEVDCSSEKTISESLASLKAEHDCLIVSSVDERLYGSQSVRHYELACK